jgi:hypothetical protein
LSLTVEPIVEIGGHRSLSYFHFDCVPVLPDLARPQGAQDERDERGDLREGCKEELRIHKILTIYTFTPDPRIIHQRVGSLQQFKDVNV